MFIIFQQLSPSTLHAGCHHQQCNLSALGKKNKCTPGGASEPVSICDTSTSQTSGTVNGGDYISL